MGRVLALDVGDVRIGMAVSDPMGILASPLPTLTRRSPEYDVEFIANVAKEQGAERLLSGLPRNMDGTEGIQAQKTREFAEMLAERLGLPLEFWDERLTSRMARSVMQGNISTRKQKGKVDQLAAVLILQSWLDRG